MARAHQGCDCSSHCNRVIGWLRSSSVLRAAVPKSKRIRAVSLGGPMKRRDGQGGENVKRVLDENRDELMWVAEVMAGSRPAGEQCLAEAIELADVARYIGNEWMLSW